MNLRKQILTKNRCYISGRTINPKGVMVHSTGANNPTIKRYVQPDDGYIGKNNNTNDWNRDTVDVCVHAFIGKTENGEVATYQTLPWNYRGWHCGRGKKGSANNTHISFEICEDGLSDRSYFKRVYQEAVELTAYLCNMYNLDPMKDGVVICHSEGHDRGIASNHGDVMHWFPKHGKNMNTFRADVVREMESEMTQDQFNKMMNSYLSDLAKQPPSDWSADARKWAEEKGLIVGDDNGDKQYKSFCTREQMVIFMNRLFKMVGGK